eukprot:TRINITY_DN7633_c0_g1_i1.p2 TRINITY_DN7633_c0_g1~~TRINITY_DN7633_c0_g1_i1.p2  ORF type:complete len:201 (+),score=84.47 TRINITY_DN7633_c0_g1_i1:62-664(+)
MSNAKKAPKKKENTLFKTVVVGSGGVGKSALTLQFMYGDFVEEYDPTSADSYRKKITYDGVESCLDILDTAGQEEYAAMRDNYYRSGEGFLGVFTITSSESFDHIKDFHDQILRIFDSDKVPFVLAGNKCDLFDQRQVSAEDAQIYAKKLDCEYLETSAKTNQNVEAVFMRLVKLIDQQRTNDQIEEEKANPKKSSCILF